MIRDSRLSFSIIVPFVGRNQSIQELYACWASQSIGDSYSSELILVFDGARETFEKSHSSLVQVSGSNNVRLVFCGGQKGPGEARNLGISEAQGDYLIFLDSDDLLSVDALQKLCECISKAEFPPDILSFDWQTEQDKQLKPLPRRDYRWLSNSCLAVEHFTKHHMEASVIYATYNRRFIQANQLTFPAGLHEDIAFHAKAMFHARFLEYLNYPIYIKRDLGDGLTSVWNKNRVDDYLRAYTLVSDFYGQIHHCGEIHNSQNRQTIPAAIASTSIKVSRLEELDAKRLLKYIRDRYYRQEFQTSLPRHTVYSKVIQILHEFNEDFLPRIRELDGMVVSCKDLHRSIYLAPSEIRTCCKRFFVKGEIKGDVRILKFPLRRRNETYSVDEKQIRLSKRDLFVDINYGETSDCDGCPFMEIRKWRPFEEELDLQLLSMEQHSVCNLRCTYCDETYYGGLRENYDVEGLLTSLAQAGSLDNLELAVWGGGEPVLDPQFAKYVDIVNQNAVNLTHRFLSNSLRYSEKIAELLESKTGLLVTSIDAGNEETYQTVRGRSGFAKVWSNLSRYSRTSPDRVTVKYIFTKENSTKSNVDGFVSQIKENDLKGAFFQISSDFKDEFLDQERINAILYLFASLLSINVEYVYLDDLIWQRWKIDSRRNIRDLSMPVSSTSSWQNALAVPENEEKIVFWGANQLTRLLLSEEEFRSRWNIVGVIDTNPNLWGSKVYGFEVKDPRHFAKSEIRIFLSGIQSIHMLYHSIPSYGFDKSQVLRKILW